MSDNLPVPIVVGTDETGRLTAPPPEGYDSWDDVFQAGRKCGVQLRRAYLDEDLAFWQYPTIEALEAAIIDRRHGKPREYIAIHNQPEGDSV